MRGEGGGGGGGKEEENAPNIALVVCVTEGFRTVCTEGYTPYGHDHRSNLGWVHPHHWSWPNYLFALYIGPKIVWCGKTCTQTPVWDT